MALFGTFLFGEELFGAHGVILITPDLGWADREALFDGDLNHRLVVMELEDMEQVDDIGWAKAPNSLTFPYSGINFRVRRSELHKFGGPGKYLYKIVGEWDLVATTEFIYRTGVNQVGGVGKTAEDSKVI